MSENLRALVAAGDAATLAAVRTACRSFVRSGALAGAVDGDDLTSEAVLALLDGRADSVDAAARAAYAVCRFDRVDGQAVRFQYLSSVLGVNEDGTVDTLADLLPARDEAPEVDPLADLRTLTRAAGAVRIRKGYAAHGEVMARGEANAWRGVANDADILRALEAVGGRHYGYAAKVVGYLATEGKRTNANAVRVAVFRALGRTERGKHSSRD